MINESNLQLTNRVPNKHTKSIMLLYSYYNPKGRKQFHLQNMKIKNNARNKFNPMNKD